MRQKLFPNICTPACVAWCSICIGLQTATLAPWSNTNESASRVGVSLMFLCACVRVYSSMADCSKYTVEEAGFDISALKTSLIQYFRCRNRARRAQLHASSQPAWVRSPATHPLPPPNAGIYRKWTRRDRASVAVVFPRGNKPRRSEVEEEEEEEEQWSLGGVNATLFCS